MAAVYSLNLRVFWPLVTCGCTALLGLWQALRPRAGLAWDGAPAALLLLLALLACAARRCRRPRAPAGPGEGRPVGPRRREWLEEFYARQLRLSPHVLGHSKAHVSLVVGELVRAGKAAGGRLALRGDFVQVGSAYEQHKVRRPDAFDVLVPLRLPRGAALRAEPRRAAGLRGAFVCALEVAAPGGLSEALCVAGEGGRRLSAALVLRWFQGQVQRCLGPVRARLQERVRLSLAAGPGRPLALLVAPRSDYVCCHLSLAVRLIPAIPCGEALYLTALPAAQPPAPGQLAAFWTLNVSRTEQRLLGWLKEQGPADSCHLKCLQLLKGLRDWGGRSLEQPLAAQWGRVLSSYVLKTALFALLLRGPLQAWADQFLVERLEDLVTFLEGGLRRRLLLHVFLGNAVLPEAISLPKFLKEAAPVNLLADFEGPTLDKVAAHLRNTWRQAPQVIRTYSGHSAANGAAFSRKRMRSVLALSFLVFSSWVVLLI